MPESKFELLLGIIFLAWKSAACQFWSNRALIKASTIYDVCLPDSGYDFQGPEFDGQFADTPKSRALMYAWLSSNKGVVSGVALAEALGADGVPVCYESIIRKAVGLEC